VLKTETESTTDENDGFGGNEQAETAASDVNGIYDKTSENITMSSEYPPTIPSVSSYYSGDFRVRNCKGCVITLPNAFGALRLQDLSDCTIYAGPVAGPCYVENCTNCTIVVASRQLRIHDTYDTKFFVNVRSGPIIEDCARTKFARYRLAFKGKDMVGMFKASELNLDRGSESTFWKDVKDFKWHRATKSPNFDIIEDGTDESFLTSLDSVNVEFLGGKETEEAVADVVEEEESESDEDSEEEL